MREFFGKLFWPITAPIEFIQNHFKAVLLVLIVFLLFYSSEEVKQPNLAKIHIYGPIISAEKFLDDVKKAQEQKVKGVLLVIDSPGGSVAPSVEMSLAVRQLSKTMPVVAYASGTMASGSYYAGIWAKSIIANPGAVIGSIGVLFEGANIEGLMKKIGVQSQVVKAGDYKEAGTPFRAWNQKEKQQLETVINDTYKMFVQDVATARKLDANKSLDFADARVFTGRMAKNTGLVDSLGGMKDAEDKLAELSGVKEPVWMEKSKVDKFMEEITSQAIGKISSQMFGLKAY